MVSSYFMHPHFIQATYLAWPDLNDEAQGQDGGRWLQTEWRGRERERETSQKATDGGESGSKCRLPNYLMVGPSIRQQTIDRPTGREAFSHTHRPLPPLLHGHHFDFDRAESVSVGAMIRCGYK